MPQRKRKYSTVKNKFTKLWREYSQGKHNFLDAWREYLKESQWTDEEFDSKLYEEIGAE